MANPTLLSRLLCADADKNTIPDTDAGTAGVFSQQYGWPAINSLPLSAGGKAVQRQDFNGIFNLLGGIAFYAQKGYTFEWDITQDYYANCVVTDPLDGKKYNAKNDVAKGGSNPSLDPTNWELFGRDPNALTREVTPAFNTRDVITTSGTYTAPVTGWYKITAKGGGGGGAGGYHGSSNLAGAGGGEGGTTIAYISMTANDTVTVIIGGGGAGGVANGSASDGGNTTVTYNDNTFIAGGGAGGATNGHGAKGGSGTLQGINGGTSFNTGSNGANGASGGGIGGGIGNTGSSYSAGEAGIAGGGGGGGGNNGSVGYAGGNGGDGYVWFEYFATI